jgi:hypothetical protein
LAGLDINRIRRVIAGGGRNGNLARPAQISGRADVDGVAGNVLLGLVVYLGFAVGMGASTRVGVEEVLPASNSKPG